MKCRPVIFFLLVCWVAPCPAQRLVSRDLIVNPMFNAWDDNATDIRWMNGLSAWGSFGNYLAGDNDHEWSQRLGVVVELVRFGDRSGLSFESAIEFVADPDNNIGFNPRALIWEEGFLYTHRMAASWAQIGYYHRCKHDIETLDQGVERSLIFGGLLAKWIRPVVLTEKKLSMLEARAEIYTVRQDLRTPKSFEIRDPRLEQLTGSLALKLNNQWSWAPPFGVYANVFGSLNFFGSKSGFFNRFQSVETVQFNGGAGAGVVLKGKAFLRLGLNLEYFSDPGIHPAPKDAWLLSLGLTALNPTSLF